MTTKTIDSYKEMLKLLNIPNDRYRHITSYITRMITDYRGNIIDILKEIPLNFKGNERYFTMFVIGNSSYPSFSTIGDKEREDFIKNITTALKLEKERIVLITDYMADIMLEDIVEKRIPTVDIIKKIINSNFTETEKNYMIFILGLVK